MKNLIKLSQNMRAISIFIIVILLSSCIHEDEPNAIFDIKKKEIITDRIFTYVSIDLLCLYKDSLILNKTIPIESNLIKIEGDLIGDMKSYSSIQMSIREKDLGTILNLYFEPDTLKNNILHFKKIIE